MWHVQMTNVKANIIVLLLASFARYAGRFFSKKPWIYEIFPKEETWIKRIYYKINLLQKEHLVWVFTVYDSIHQVCQAHSGLHPSKWTSNHTNKILVKSFQTKYWFKFTNNKCQSKHNSNCYLHSIKLSVMPIIYKCWWGDSPPLKKLNFISWFIIKL